MQLEPSGKVVLEYTSPHGPKVTHVRGILLANAQNNLRELGVWEQYLARLPEVARGQLSGVIAATWMDVDIAAVHYQTAGQVCFENGIGERDFEQIGDKLAARIAETFLGMTIRSARNAGLESFVFVMRQNGRMWDRMYMGGGCMVTQHGPKEIVLEDHGNPLLDLRSFRVGYNAYMKAMSSLFCKTVFVRAVRPSQPGPGRLATRFSWV